MDERSRILLECIKQDIIGLYGNKDLETSEIVDSVTTLIYDIFE